MNDLGARVIIGYGCEAISGFAGLLARVRAGAEIVIEQGATPVAVLHMPAPPCRSIEDCIALLPESSTATIDEEFARDVEKAVARIANRSNHRHGTDSRFKRPHRGRTQGREPDRLTGRRAEHSAKLQTDSLAKK
jgi:hypothetical protein